MSSWDEGNTVQGFAPDGNNDTVNSLTEDLASLSVVENDDDRNNSNYSDRDDDRGAYTDKRKKFGQTGMRNFSGETRNRGKGGYSAKTDDDWDENSNRHGNYREQKNGRGGYDDNDDIYERDYQQGNERNRNNDRRGFDNERNGGGRQFAGKNMQNERNFADNRGRNNYKENNDNRRNGDRDYQYDHDEKKSFGRVYNSRAANRNQYDDDDDRRGDGFNNGRNKFDGNNNNSRDNKKREFYIPPEVTTDEDELFSNGITTGINFSNYDNIPVKVSGREPPQPIESFKELGLLDIILKNVTKSGYKKPTPIQKVSMPILLAGRDLMACAQTGSGKTAAFLVPILNTLLENSYEVEIGKPFVIVLSPTRELANQIYVEAKKFSHSSCLKIAIVYGGTSSKHQSENLARGCHVLIATPGRLLDFVEKGYISFENVDYVVLDEADRMLDMGFKDSIDTVMNHPTMAVKNKPICCMFSATFPNEIQTLASKYLENYLFVCIGTVGGACSDVKQTFYELPKTKKRNKLVELLEQDPTGTIVFVETKRSTDFLASFLSEKDFPTTSIHGDRLQSQREAALRDFKTGKMKILMATSVAARGLDIKNVRHVINYDLPDSVDEYVHRIGRTGRLGNNGRSTAFFDPDRDGPLAADLVRILESSNQEVPSFLLSYAHGVGGSKSSKSHFGGTDIRDKSYKQKEFNCGYGPALQETEESWD